MNNHLHYSRNIKAILSQFANKLDDGDEVPSAHASKSNAMAKSRRSTTTSTLTRGTAHRGARGSSDDGLHSDNDGDDDRNNGGDDNNDDDNMHSPNADDFDPMDTLDQDWLNSSSQLRTVSKRLPQLPYRK